MAATRADVESMLLRACKGWMIACGLDGTTQNGSNADLAVPIAFAVRTLGLPVAAPLNPSDAEIAAIPDGSFDFFLTLATYRVIQTCIRNYAEINQTVGLNKQEFDDLSKRMRMEADALHLELTKMYGFGKRSGNQSRVGTITAGDTWPVGPVPPIGPAPYPQTPYTRRSGRFNP